MNYLITKVDLRPFEKRQNEPRKNKNKMFIFIEGETVVDNLLQRRTRPYNDYKKNIIPLVMDYIKDMLPNHYNELKDAKWHWDQMCGCSVCPCSPGFYTDSDGRTTIYVNVTIS